MSIFNFFYEAAFFPCSSHKSVSALKGTGQSCSRIGGYLAMKKSNGQGQPKCAQILIIQIQILEFHIYPPKEYDTIYEL